MACNLLLIIYLHTPCAPYPIRAVARPNTACRCVGGLGLSAVCRLLAEDYAGGSAAMHWTLYDAPTSRTVLISMLEPCCSYTFGTCAAVDTDSSRAVRLMPFLPPHQQDLPY